jgi:hypothetical protein
MEKQIVQDKRLETCICGEGETYVGLGKLETSQPKVAAIVAATAGWV